VGQLETLVEERWISIDRLKRGPANHKAFLTSEGKKIVKAQKKDIEFVRQTIGHRSLNATSGYISEMVDQERQDRISSIS
jgi:hypothetical protein